MKKTFYLITALAGLLFVATSVKAQYGYGFNSADPNIVFTGGNNPAAPDWSNYYKILKWGHTNRLGWNPYNYGYKCYWHRGMVFRVKFPKCFFNKEVGKYGGKTMTWACNKQTIKFIFLY